MFDLKFSFVNNFSIGSLFKFKDCLSLDMTSHVVYRLDCLNSSTGYIGGYHLFTSCKGTGTSLYSYQCAFFSSGRSFTIQTGHSMDWSNVKILASDSDEQSSFYLESLLMLKHKSILNKMHSSIIIICLRNLNLK